MAMKFQRKNGSLFNSPATTAAAFIHINNTQGLDYLLSLSDKFGDAVPTVHPFDVYARLHVVDSLEKLGINRHFKEEIQSVLDETWRLWQQEDDIFLEPTTCALAFRLLRLQGYDVSSDILGRFSEDKFYNTVQGYLKDVEAVLELHKASHIVLHSSDLVLEELNLWTGHFLEEYLSTSSRNTYKPASNRIDNEGGLWRVEWRNYIFQSQKQKLPLSLLDSRCHTYPPLNIAKHVWHGPKQSLLGCVVDDFYDVWGLKEEHINLIQLMEKWDVDVSRESCSDTVKIIFVTLKKTICETATQAYKVQGRSVLNHLIQIEAEWCRNRCVPSVEEYEHNGIINGLGTNNYPCEEKEQGKFINSISLRLIHGCGVESEEEIMEKIKRKIEEKRKELLRLVLKEKEAKCQEKRKMCTGK
ncbi:ent-kaurene synthase-like 2 [Prosopis cineraria]|uniref:ent-kaurene synthase-like 2 n=1 Tax=Prosopis cineraria TaxID=364024 RepID=UPI00240F5029|nr:ent-kaurene synthase-like 2 [Prosopis cineraria]